MALPQKRKRPVVYTIEDDSDDCVVIEKDDEYKPESKKQKRASSDQKSPKSNKLKKPPKPKVVKKKLKENKSAPRKIKKKEKTLENHEIYPFLNDEGKSPSNENLTSVGKVVNKANEAELERIATSSINAAKKYCHSWKDEEVVSENCHVPFNTAKGVIDLLNQECTIPFIVRYRKHVTGGLQAEKIREIQTAYEEVKLVHKKVDSILKTVRHEKFDESVAASFLCAKSLDEVELLYAPFKAGSKRTLAERSKQLGLEPVSLRLLECRGTLQSVNVPSLVKPQKGLENEKDILSGIQHIIADKISKDRKVLDFLREKASHPQIRLASSKSAAADKEDKKAFVEGKTTQNFKYENYYQLNASISSVAPHQVMALNRGEKQKVLTVKVQVPPRIRDEICGFVWRAFFGGRRLDPDTAGFLRTCAEDAYDRLIEPYLCRQIRSGLTKRSEKESIAVFGSNVRTLVLTPPVRGRTVLGVDPGFAHGCKVAAVSPKGEVLQTGVIYPHSTKMKPKVSDEEKLRSIVMSHGAEIVAIGNGTACRETEQWLSGLIKARLFHPLDVKYCIVNESGASVYSVTKEAEAELPGMDPNIRSAVSIARRLQDPLLEYVKIEPKHLGVGMYQHDVPESDLKKALDGVVEECVSFVGVDLNVCPELLLRKISGLSASRARAVAQWRAGAGGGFLNRRQLLQVKGLGQKSFEQCAGFVRILPETAPRATAVGGVASGSSKKKRKEEAFAVNPLDRTIIHPESYDVAERFIEELKLNPENIGQQSFVDQVENYMKFTSLESLAQKLRTTADALQLIVEAFRQLQDYDIRAELDQPLFLRGVLSLGEVRAGQELSGRVTNVTGFGAFVDAGVGTDGLVHVSKMRGRAVRLGDRVRVRVISTDLHRKRLALDLLPPS